MTLVWSGRTGLNEDGVIGMVWEDRFDQTWSGRTGLTEVGVIYRTKHDKVDVNAYRLKVV